MKKGSGEIVKYTYKTLSLNTSIIKKINVDGNTLKILENSVLNCNTLIKINNDSLKGLNPLAASVIEQYIKQISSLSKSTKINDIVFNLKKNDKMYTSVINTFTNDTVVSLHGLNEKVTALALEQTQNFKLNKGVLTKISKIESENNSTTEFGLKGLSVIGSVAGIAGTGLAVHLWGEESNNTNKPAVIKVVKKTTIVNNNISITRVEIPKEESKSWYEYFFG